MHCSPSFGGRPDAAAPGEREHYDYTNTYSVPPAVPNYDDLNLSLDLLTTEFSVDYSLPLSKDRTLKVGLDAQKDNDDFGNSGDTVDPATRITASPKIPRCH